jgi:phytoene synthase
MAYLPADLHQVTQIVRASGTSFYHGMRVLPPGRRFAMYAIYAFCRLVDDIADEPGPFADKRAALDAWRLRIRAIYNGKPPEAMTPEDAVVRVLREAIGRYELREQDFMAVIDGMQMDAESTIVAPTLAELDLYCDRVAVAVGRLSVRAFGDASPAADAVAHALGRALQLTNILRDIDEDAQRGRLYLPREYLQESGIALDPEAARHAAALPQLCQRVASRAHNYFAQARSAMQDCNKKAMRPARLMAANYDAVLSALEARGWTRLQTKVSLSKWRKLWILLTC